MRRIHVLASILSLILMLVLSGILEPELAAQEATPTPVPLSSGVVTEVLTAVPTERAPDHTLYLVRATFEPGGEIFAHSHPGTVLISVESGAFGWTLLQGTAHVIRGAATGGTAAEEVTEPGTEVILNPGDAIHYESDVVHTARNADDGTTVILTAQIAETGQPRLIPAGTPMAGMEMGATPTR